MCDFVFGSCFVIKFFMSFLVLQHLAEEERTACFTFIVFFLYISVSLCSLSLPCGAMVGLSSVTVAFLGHSWFLLPTV